MTRPRVLHLTVLGLYRLGTYPAKLAHEATHVAAVRPFVSEYDTQLHPLGPTRFHTPERYAWPLMTLGALAPTLVGTALAVVMAITAPVWIINAFTAVPYWLLTTAGLSGYPPPDNVVGWALLAAFWFIYTWPSAADRAAITPGSGG